MATNTTPNQQMPAEPPTEADSLSDRKGLPVSLRGGSLKKHKNYVGAWLDLAKPPTDCFFYVIIEKPHPKKANKTWLKSYACGKQYVKESNPCISYTQTVMQQVPQLAIRLDALALTAAKCRIKGDDAELHSILATAIDDQTIKLVKQGSNAEYKNIIYDDDDEGMNV